MKPKRKPKSPFDMTVFLTKANRGRATAEYRTNDRIFVQGDPANAVFYIKEGKVKLTVLSKQGKEAVVGILGAGGRDPCAPRRAGLFRSICRSFALSQRSD